MIFTRTTNLTSNKWCKWYCLKSDKNPEAKKVCNKPNCKNNERAKILLKQYSEKLLTEIEKNLY